MHTHGDETQHVSNPRCSYDRDDSKNARCEVDDRTDESRPVVEDSPQADAQTGSQVMTADHLYAYKRR